MDVSQIKFGTDGWRGIIAEDFTFDNVRACAQGVAAYEIQQSGADRPIVVGYDTRFASEEFAAHTAEVLAGNGLPVLLSSQVTPTPVLSHAVVNRGARGGVIITASHNPAAWNGFKVRTHYGGSPPVEALEEIEAHVRRIEGPAGVRRLSLSDARSQGLVQNVDATAPYLEHVATVLDLKPLQDSGLRVVVDAMHGAGAGYLPRLLDGPAGSVREIRAERNPAFPGMHNPEPVEHNLAALAQVVADEHADVGLALDGDADRLGVMDEHGQFITQLQTYALLVYYLLEVRGLRGLVVKSVTTSSMIWRLGELYGVPVRETGVGFKYIAPLMAEENALAGGEESGGYAFRGHLPERDGILSGLFVLDLMARTGKRLPELLEELYRLVGPHHYARWDVPFDPTEQGRVRDRVSQAKPDTLGGVKVTGRDAIDGFRFHLQGGGWAIVRSSGTEPLLRIYAEAESPDRVQRILADTRALAGV